MVDLCWANINIATVFLLYVCVCVYCRLLSLQHTQLVCGKDTRFKHSSAEPLEAIQGV